MMKETIKIKIDQTKLPNKMHFEVQRTTRAHTFKASKGKGSWRRNEKHKKNLVDEN